VSHSSKNDCLHVGFANLFTLLSKCVIGYWDFQLVVDWLLLLHPSTLVVSSALKYVSNALYDQFSDRAFDLC